MANPQKEHGYVGLANELWDEIIRRDFTKRQKDVLHFILRISYGCGRKTAHVPMLKDFSMCGVGKTNITRELTFLEQCEVISWDRRQNDFEFNKNYKDWQVSPVRDWNSERFKQIIHINLLAAKQERRVIEMRTETGQDELSKEEHEVIETITESAGSELSKQEPQVIESITDTGLNANQGAVSESSKKGLKKEKIKDLLKEHNPAFELFWSKYPRKVRKKEALEIWLRLMKLKIDPELLTRCAENYAAYCQANVEAEKYILHAATFLHPDKERYMDYLNPVTPKQSAQGANHSGGRNAQGGGIGDIPPEQQNLSDRFTKRT